jgi:hypothetical protein
MKACGFTLPVSVVAGKPERIESAWGLGRLPWLLLADTGKVVRAEGFRLDELAEALRTLNSPAAE